MSSTFISHTGELLKNDASCAVIRPIFARTFSRIQNTQQLRATIRAGQHAWLGGYQMFLSTKGGDALCFDCAAENYALDWVREDVNGCAINYEDEHLYCAHCNKGIPAAYGSDE